MHIDLEARQPGVVRDQTAPGSAIEQCPPLIQCRVVVDVGEEAEASAVGAWLVRSVESVTRDPETVDEDRLSRSGGGLPKGEDREGTEK